MQTFELSNGVKIPAIGYGTWKSPDSEVTVEGIKTAVSCGYRHIDTAAVYGNEVSVGKGVADCGIPREELFITSKVWNTEQGRKPKIIDQTDAAFLILCTAPALLLCNDTGYSSVFFIR